MQALPGILVGLGLLLGQASGKAVPPAVAVPDLAQLAEGLHDRLDPRGQSQAALLLLQSDDAAAEKLLRRTLRLPDNEEAFVALAAALRLRQDGRFTEELFAALTSSKLRVRQGAAEALAVLPAADLVRRLAALAADTAGDLRVRQLALWTLGRCGRQAAVPVLLGHLEGEHEELRRVAAGALADLTAQAHGLDVARWRTWWERHKDQSAEQWLQMRLAYQATRSQRLEGELLRARAQVLRLHQQLYTALPAAGRFAHLQSLLESDDAGVRALAVVWCVELLPAADAERQGQLAKMLLRLTHDASLDVQRAAVLALGRTLDAAAFVRVQELLRGEAPLVRAAAVRALAQQARGSTPEARLRLKQAVPLLQQALEDRGLEVVVEAAEALGTLGVPEAGPVLTGLLRHPSEHVRQTVAQALERTADAGLVEGLLAGLDDPGETVRFSLLGAISRAAGNGQTIPPETRKRLLTRLETLLRRDPDAGIRSRAATVLGECGGHEVLPTLWQQVLTSGEERVREKAWEAFVEAIARAGSVPLAERWDRTLVETRQISRRVQMWGRVYSRWEPQATLREPATRALEGMAQAQLDAGKWAAAAPLVQNLLARTVDASEAQRSRWLRWVVQIAEAALAENNRGEAARVLQEARPYLPKGDALAERFEALEKQAGTRPQ